MSWLGEGGYLVDIGAGDGISNSNSRWLLESRSWSGLLLIDIDGTDYWVLATSPPLPGRPPPHTPNTTWLLL